MHYKNLEQLSETLTAQKETMADYVIHPKDIRMYDNVLRCVAPDGAAYAPNDSCHVQLAGVLNIPVEYYRRMKKEIPVLLDKTFNEWIAYKAEKPGAKSFLLRTFEQHEGNIARAVLSDRYGMIDNYDVFFAALQAIQQSGVNVEIKECEVTERKMYINVLAPEVEVQAEHALRNYLREHGESSRGWGIVSGMVITNSETGHGRYVIRPRGHIIRCGNGFIAKDAEIARTHLGAKMDEGRVKWSAQTRQKNFELIISQTVDAVKHFLSKDFLSGLIDVIDLASNVELDYPVDTVQHAVRLVANDVIITPEQEKGILNYFLKSGDLSAAGVFQSLTNSAKEMPMDDRYIVETAAFSMLPQIKGLDKPFAKN